MAANAAPLDRHKIPRLARQLLLEAAPGAIKSARIICIRFMLFRLCPVLGHGAAAHGASPADEDVAAGLGDILRVLCRIAGEAVADRQKADGFDRFSRRVRTEDRSAGRKGERKTGESERTWDYDFRVEMQGLFRTTD